MFMMLAEPSLDAPMTGTIRTLIVDDEPDIRLLLRVMVELFDPRVRVIGEAGNGEEALARVEEFDPEVIVLDQRMPGLGGIDTAARLRHAGSHTRIILCTADLTVDIRDRAEQVGVDTCLSKIDMDRVPAEIIRLSTLDP